MTEAAQKQSLSSNAGEGRNNAIEFLRFIFALIVLGIHATGFVKFPDLHPRIEFFRNGGIGVEFFFVLSGFLMAKSAMAKPTGKSLGKETTEFMGKRFMGIFPYFLYSCIVGYVIKIFVEKLSGFALVEDIVMTIPHLFFFDITGIPQRAVNMFSWYLSAMLWAMFILYPIIRRHFEIFVRVIAPLLSVFIMGYIFHTTYKITANFEWLVVNQGILRAISAICLGCISFKLFTKIKDLSFSKMGVFILSVFEVLGYLAAIVYSCTRESELYYCYLVVFMAISIAITFSGKTHSKVIFKGSFFAFLGKLSLPLYINQYYSQVLVIRYLSNASEAVKLIGFALTNIITAILCIAIVDFLKKKINIKSIMLKEA